MSKTLKNLMVVLVAVLMFFSSAFTPVRAEEAETDPVTDEVTEETIESSEQEIIPEEEPETEENAIEENTVLEEEAIQQEIEEEAVPEETEEAIQQEIEEEAVPEETEEADVDLSGVSIRKIPALDGGITVNADNDTKEGENLKPLGTSKTLKYNNDGTYTLALSVTGDSQSSSETTTKSVNVVIVYDASGSMNDFAAAKYGSRRTNGDQLYKKVGSNYVAITDDENYDGTVYRWSNSQRQYVEYTDDRCMNARRKDVTEYAIYNMANELSDGKIQFAFVYFSNSTDTNYKTFGGDDSYWTTNPNTDFSTFLSTTGTLDSNRLNQYASGTNWQAGLGKALDPVLASADSEDTYVLFITDGAPNNGWGTSQEDSYEAALDNARAIETYKTSTHESVTDKTDNTTMFAIYAYGTESDYLDDLTYYALKGTERTAGTDTNITDDIEGRYFNAGSTEALNSAIKTITDTIQNNVDYGGVSYSDGIATDTTNTTLNTSVDGDVSGLTYTVSVGNSEAYKVTTTGSEIKFIIDGEEFDSVKGTYHFEEDDKDYEYYYAIDDNGDPLTFTVGTGDDAQTYEYKMSLASFDGGELEWDLTGVGGLIGGYTYTLSFTVWPVQKAYDIAADLNNGLDTYKWDTTLETYEDRTADLGYEVGGVKDYEHIVKYTDGTYAVLTNTSQQVDYYIVNTEIVNGVPSTTYDGPYHAYPTSPPPMQLVGSRIDLVKEWLVSLSPEELADWVSKGNKLKLRVTTDGDKYVDCEFPKEGMIIESDEAGNVLWKQTVSIAPGLMVSESHAIQSGIDVSKYKSVTLDETTYYILGEGHDYTVEEISGSDPHFEFETQMYHPMVVDGTPKNISFETNDDGSIKDGSTATVTNANLTELKGTNKLKGGISIYKEVYDADMTTKIESTGEFAFKVTLWAEDEKGNKSPVYTTDDQFEGDKPVSGSFGYRVYEDKEFEATSTSDTTWTIQDGETVITITYDAEADKYTGSDDQTYTPNEDESVFTRRDTIQRDAIYDGTSPASVTVGSEVTEMTLTMQANQYCFIVNVPAGTKYTVEEIQGDGYKHFYSSVSVLEGDDTTGIYEVVEEKELEDGAVELTDHIVDGYVSANSSSKAIFKNWAGSFYVYHSKDNTIEKISFADKRVKGTYDATVDPETQKPVGYKYTFNIVDETKDGTLYGGYYKAYKSAKVTNDQIIGTASEGNLKYTKDETTNRYWSRDTVKAPYTGDIAGIWKKSEAYTDKVQATGGGTGTAMTPVANTVYYLKEVPNGYIRPYIHYVYDDYRDDKPLKQLYLITASDDTNYTSVGYMVTKGDAKEPTMITTKASLLISFTSPTRGKTTLKVKTIWDDKEYHGDKVKLNRGYLYSTNCSDVINSTVTFRPCWTTLDKVLVQGVTVRKVTNITTKNDITVDDQKAVD